MSAQLALLPLEASPEDGEPVWCISLWQPWASLMALGFKPDETRHWPTQLRGRTAIHAAKKIDREGAPADLCRFAFGRADWWVGMATGAVVTVGDLWDCRRCEDIAGEITAANDEAGNHAPGRFAHRYRDLRPLVAPIPLTGRQGFFRWRAPADLDARLGPAPDHAALAKAYLARAA